MYLVKDIKSGNEYHGIIVQLRGMDVLITGEDLYFMEDLTGLEDGNYFKKSQTSGRWDERGKLVKENFKGEEQLLREMVAHYEVLSHMHDEESELQLQLLQKKYKKLAN